MSLLAPPFRNGLRIILFHAMTTFIYGSEVPDDPEHFDLYLLVGQSNMAGRGLLEDEDRQPVDRILVLNGRNEWVWKGEPVHFDKPVAGVGLGFTFAKLMAESKPEATIGLIPCAVGGTGIDKWMPGTPLFERAVERTRIAMQKGRLKGILWHQGEGTSGTQEGAASYASNLAEVIAAFRWRKPISIPSNPLSPEPLPVHPASLRLQYRLHFLQRQTIHHVVPREPALPGRRHAEPEMLESRNVMRIGD